MRLNNVNSTKSYRNAMTYIDPCSWKYSILSSTSLLVLEFQQAGTGRAILLTCKRSSIGCRQEYCREAATICAPRLYIWGDARNKLFRSSKQVVFPGETSYFEKQNKLFSLSKQLILHQGIKRTKARSSKETFPGISPFVAWNSWILSGSTVN